MNTYSDYSDNELVKLLRLDNVTAFTELYNRYWRKLYTTCNSILHNTDAASDIVQDIFTSLWERRFDIEIDFPSAYLYQAARFQVFKAIRSNKTDNGFYDRLAQASSVIVTDNLALFNELSELLNTVLVHLPSDQREAFMLSREAGLSYREIAGKMNISVKTVEKKMSSTLKSLRIGLDEAFIAVFLLLSIFF